MSDKHTSDKKAFLWLLGVICWWIGGLELRLTCLLPALLGGTNFSSTVFCSFSTMTTALSYSAAARDEGTFRQHIWQKVDAAVGGIVPFAVKYCICCILLTVLLFSFSQIQCHVFPVIRKLQTCTVSARFEVCCVCLFVYIYAYAYNKTHVQILTYLCWQQVVHLLVTDNQWHISFPDSKRQASFMPENLYLISISICKYLSFFLWPLKQPANRVGWCWQ